MKFSYLKVLHGSDEKMERELNRCGISGDVNVPENPSEDRAEPEGKASFNMCYINTF